MSKTKLYALLLAAWLIPVIGIFIAQTNGPSSSSTLQDFPSEEFVPKEAAIYEIKRKRSTAYELRIVHADDRVFLLNNPEVEPLEEILRAIPEDAKLALVYDKALAGELTIFNLALADEPRTVFVDFETVKADHAKRKNIIYIVCGALFVVLNGAFFVLRKQAANPSSKDGEPQAA